ncbi:MAG: type II secretion system F family protein [Candidatus Micrarchaeota archaeon]
MPKIVITRKFMATKPKEADTTVARLLVYAGVEQSTEMWLGSRLLLAFTIGFFAAFIPIIVAFALNEDLGFGFPGKFNLAFMFGYMLLSFSFTFALILTLVYLHLYYVIHDRTRRVDEVLPDFLLMVAAHMHAGLTPFAAFQSAARPEFGPLEKEVKKIAAYSMGTESFTDALLALTRHIDSPILRRTIAFFENGLRSGGKLANLLETAAEEIRDLEEIRQETVLNTRTYTIFLVFILVGGLPVLLAISTEFLGIFSQMQSQIKVDTVRNVGNMLAPTMNISAEFVNQMAIILIITTATLVSIFIGIISEGKVLFGLKYMPPLAILSFAIYTAIKLTLHGFLSVFF